MTSEDQDAIVGRIVRERRDERARHQALIHKATTIGELLRHLGSALETRVREPRGGHIIDISSEGQIMVVEPPPDRRRSGASGAYPALDDIRTTLAEIDAVEQKLAHLDEQLKGFGV